MGSARRVVAALDKFRGTATATAACGAVADACWPLGLDVDRAPLADGGEGLLEALGGANRTTTVTGPLGVPVAARWRLAQRTAVIEMAEASGLLLAGGAEGNDPLLATTRGVGELLVAAVDQGARTIIVGLGGSATTDGGLGAVEALPSPARLGPIELLVACDVETRFVDAARDFGPQKGASAAQVAMLTTRLEQLVGRYREQFGVDVAEFDGGGAAGGLAGGLAALGGVITPGFDLVAEHLDLAARIAAADLVVTGEGFLDEQSLRGKVVGGVLGLAAASGRPTLIICGDAEPAVAARLESGSDADGPPSPPRVVVRSLVAEFGPERPFAEPLNCITELTERTLPTLLA